MNGISAALHEHLSTNKWQGKKWDFDEIIGKTKRALGHYSILVISGFADARSDSDKRYETFIDKYSRYSKTDLNGKATLVQDDNTGILVINGLEAEIGHDEEHGSILVIGLERDTGLKAGTDVSHLEFLEQLKGKDVFSFYVHPFHYRGSGPILKRKNEKLTDLASYLNPVTGIEVTNAEACLPFPLQHINANKDASDFFIKVKRRFPHLVPIKASDGHSIWEIGNISTRLSYINLRALDSWDRAYTQIKDRFDSLARYYNVSDLEPKIMEKIYGCLGAARHATALTLGRKLRIPKTEEDW